MNLDDRIGISPTEKDLRKEVAVLERRLTSLQTENLRLKSENERLKAMVK